MAQRTIGVLALQGAFECHRPHIEALGDRYLEVRDKSALEEIDGLILPGGESSVMAQLLHSFQWVEPLKQFLLTRPSWGVCAGAILLSRTSDTGCGLGVIGMNSERNSYGPQINSFETTIEQARVSFIRAPKFQKLSDKVVVRGAHQGDPVWVEQGLSMATSFHPELSGEFPSPFHRYFSEKVGKLRQASGREEMAVDVR